MTSRAANQVNGEHHQQNQRPLRRPAPPNHYTVQSYTSSSAASFKGCCCCLFLFLMFLALLAVAVVLVIILAVKPKKPQFDLQQVGVQYLLVTQSAAQAPAAGIAATGGGSDAAYLSLNITLLFTAENPNKVEIKYGGTTFYVMYKGVPLGKAIVPGFEQPAHSARLVQTRLAVDRVNVMQADALELVRDATLNDRVELTITGDVGAKIRFLGFTSPRVQVSVDCAIVISPRRQSLTYKQCGVDGLNV